MLWANLPTSFIVGMTPRAPSPVGGRTLLAALASAPTLPMTAPAQDHTHLAALLRPAMAVWPGDPHSNSRTQRTQIFRRGRKKDQRNDYFGFSFCVLRESFASFASGSWFSWFAAATAPAHQEKLAPSACRISASSYK
ncbi:hypothetical protein [Ottowia sp.]|uniref:hypothetical protein n=2 Tax=Ottowia sp. TaxID=1898956 RepID=UPI002D1FA7BA|nr:hypothetical protein [Ottowia sp.]